MVSLLSAFCLISVKAISKLTSTSFWSKYFTSPVTQFDSILVIINYYSYKMLTEPLSKVSALTVVIRIRSKTPDSVTPPPPEFAVFPPIRALTVENTHRFKEEDKSVNVAWP